MVLATGIHPGELKDMVCFPDRTTIEAVATLEEKDLRTAILKKTIKLFNFKTKNMHNPVLNLGRG